MQNVLWIPQLGLSRSNVCAKIFISFCV